MVFQPSGVVCVLVKVLRRYKVMLTANHPTKAGKETFGIIRVGAVKVAVGFLVIDAAHSEPACEVIPVACFVCEDG